MKIQKQKIGGGVGAWVGGRGGQLGGSGWMGTEK